MAPMTEQKNMPSDAEEIARILAMGILRLRLRNNKESKPPKSVDLRVNGSIHDRKENGHE